MLKEKRVVSKVDKAKPVDPMILKAFKEWQSKHWETLTLLLETVELKLYYEEESGFLFIHQYGWINSKLKIREGFEEIIFTWIKEEIDYRLVRNFKSWNSCDHGDEAYPPRRANKDEYWRLVENS